MRATKVEALCQEKRFNTVPNHKSGKSHSEADRNWSAEGGIACRPTDTRKNTMPGCEGRRYTLEFCGRGAKENILVQKLWLELTILIGADATLLPEHEDQVKPPTTFPYPLQLALPESKFTTGDHRLFRQPGPRRLAPARLNLTSS